MRGNGGYVIAPGATVEAAPERAARGLPAFLNAYKADLPAAPDWLSALLGERRTASDASPVAALGREPTEREVSYAEAALKGEAGKLAGTGEGGRNNQLNISAFKLAGYVRDGLLEREDSRSRFSRPAKRMAWRPRPMANACASTRSSERCEIAPNASPPKKLISRLR